MRQVVVQAEIGALRADGWNAVTSEFVEAEALIHPEDRFEAPNETVHTAKGAGAVGCLKPVSLGVLSASVLRTQLESGILWFPPDVSTKEVLVGTLQLPVVGTANLEALIRQIETDAAAGGTVRLEV